MQNARRKVKADIIAEFTRDGDIIPLRIRVEDDDGELHPYTVKGYKPIYSGETYLTPEGIYVTNQILSFECSIIVFDQTKYVKLYFDTTKSEWMTFA